MEPKPNTDHVEEVESTRDAIKDHGFTADSSTLPKGYFTSSFFLGTMSATGLSLTAGVGAYALAAPNLAYINNDIGPDPNYVWISLVYTMALAIGLLLVGRLSDLFGRRWFFICGQALASVGCVVCATASTIKILIGGMVLISLAASTQLSFGIVSNELLYLWTIPTSGFGPLVSKAFIFYTPVTLRGGYYLMVGVNALSGLLYYLFYTPPTFHMKFGNRTKLQQLKEFDFLGCFLFMTGLLLFLMGLSWGGSVSSKYSLYETYAKIKEPVVPIHLFKKFSWVACSTNLGLGASAYYEMAIIWPQMIAVLYTEDGGASMHAGALSSLVGLMIISGQLIGGALAVPIGKTKIQCCFFIGWNETVCLANAGIDVDDQREIGTAIGAAGSLRSAISTIASTVYVITLANRLNITIPEIVPPALIAAGLPESSVAVFLSGFSTGNFSGVEGLTDEISGIDVWAYKEASAKAYSTVFLTSLIFTGIAVVLSVFTPNVDEKMTGEVAVTLHQRGNEEAVVAEKGI